MAKASIIPMRPDGFRSPLTQGEQTCLTWYVLSGCTKEEAFLTFARPDMAESKAKAVVKESIKQFYARADVKDYLMAYRQTLDAVLHPVAKKEVPVGSLEERMAQVKSKALEFAMELVENIEQAEDPDFVLKMADKVGILDGNVEVEEQPQRYLPVTCDGCAYRKFVEENCEEAPDGTEIVEEE